MKNLVEMYLGHIFSSNHNNMLVIVVLLFNCNTYFVITGENFEEVAFEIFLYDISTECQNIPSRVNHLQTTIAHTNQVRQ